MAKKEKSDELIVVDAERYHKVKKALEASKAGDPAAPTGLDEKESTRELIVVDVQRYKKVKQALADSEERYRQLFENVPIGIYRTTPDGRIADANPALVKMLGYDSFAGLAKRNLEKDAFEPGYDRGSFIRLLEREGEIKGLEAGWKKKDGSLIQVRENAKLIRDDAGQVFFEGTVEDITQSKKAEEAQRARSQQIEILNCIISQGNLAESLAEMLEVILDCMVQPLAFDNAGIFMYDPDSRTVQLKARRGTATGFSLDQRYMDIERLPFSQVLGRGEPIYLDDTEKTQPIFYEQWGWRMAGSVPLLSKGRVVGALSVASCRRRAFSPEEKITLEMIGKEAGTLVSKLQTEAALRESEKYYRTLIDTSPDIIAVMDLEARLITVNQQFLKAGGYFYDEVIGACTYDFVAGLDRDLLARRTEQFVEKRKVSGSEYIFRKKDGQTIPLDVSAGFLFDDAGNPGGIIAIGRDVSERRRADEALRASEEKFRSIAEQTSDLIAITDGEGGITYASPSALSIFQYAPEEMIGRNFSEFLDASSVPTALAAFRTDQLPGRRSIGLELLMKRKDGSVFSGELNGSSFQYGDRHGSLVVIRDISPRKRTEAALRDSEQKYRTLFDSAGDSIIIHDARERVLAANRLAAERLGYTPEELHAMTISAIDAPGDRPHTRERIEKLMREGELTFETFHQHKDGALIPFEVNSRRIDWDGQPAMLSTCRDISERKQAENALRQSEETFRRTFAAIPSPAYMWVDQDGGRITLSQCNQAAEGITEGKIRGFLGIDVDLLYADRPELAGKIKATMRSGKPLSEEIQYTFQSTGETKWLVVDYVRTSPGHVMVITRDVSERKEAEARLLAYQEQLRALSSELTLVEERERRRIASDLHDQIGQNLALCKLKVAALEKGRFPEKAKSELSAVRRLLECSIQDARSLIFDLSPPVLYELGFEAALEWLAEWIGEQFHVPVDFESHAAGRSLETDRQVILFQVVRELLVNMGKHSQAGRAKVILSLEGPLLKIQVNDDGRGFDASLIFNPRNRQGGYGFFSMRERLNYLGGSFDVRSKPGMGSQITLTVPWESPAPENGRKEDP